MMKILKLNDDYFETTHEGTYDLRLLDFQNITGTVYAHASSFGYLNSYLRGEFSPRYASLTDLETLDNAESLKDQLRIEVVRNVDIQPKYKAIFAARENQFSF